MTVAAADGFGLCIGSPPFRVLRGDGGQLFADDRLQERGLASDEALVCHPGQRLQLRARSGRRSDPREPEVQRTPCILSRTLCTMKRVGVEQKGARPAWTRAISSSGWVPWGLSMMKRSSHGSRSRRWLPGTMAHDSFIDQGETQLDVAAWIGITLCPQVPPRIPVPVQDIVGCHGGPVPVPAGEHNCAGRECAG